MNVGISMFLYFVIFIPTVKGANIDKFKWTPRVGLTFNIPKSTLKQMEVQKPTLANIQKGTVVMFDGFHAGLTMVALIYGIQAAKKFNHRNPLSSYFYTNAWRWWVRYITQVPKWLGTSSGHYSDTHKVWRKRYFYMNRFVPKWIRSILNVFLDDIKWEKEEFEFKQFLKYAEPAFGLHYIYPSKVFENFKSQDTYETIEGLDSIYSLEYTVKIK